MHPKETPHTPHNFRKGDARRMPISLSNPFLDLQRQLQKQNGNTINISDRIVSSVI